MAPQDVSAPRVEGAQDIRRLPPRRCELATRARSSAHAVWDRGAETATTNACGSGPHRGKVEALALGVGVELGGLDVPDICHVEVVLADLPWVGPVSSPPPAHPTWKQDKQQRSARSMTAAKGMCGQKQAQTGQNLVLIQRRHAHNHGDPYGPTHHRRRGFGAPGPHHLLPPACLHVPALCFFSVACPAAIFIFTFSLEIPNHTFSHRRRANFPSLL